MADIVNLRNARKRAGRRLQEERAAENRIVYGQSKADRDREDEQREKAARHLDQHRIDTGDDR